MVGTGDDDPVAPGDAGRDGVRAVRDHRVLAVTADYDRGRLHQPEPVVDRRIVLAELSDDEEGRHRGADLRSGRLVVARGSPGRQAELHQTLPVARRVPPDELADVGVIRRPRVVRRAWRDQDQGRDAVRIIECQGERGPAAAAVTDDDRRASTRIVQHRAQVVEPGERDGRG